MSKTPDPSLVVRRPLCECGGQTVYSGEALMGSLRCDKCDQWLMGVGNEFIETINLRWIRGDRGYVKDTGKAGEGTVLPDLWR